MEKQSSELHSDLLTRWVFGINRFLGNWPFTSQIFTPFALWDWLRMISISSIYVTCTWCQIQSEYIGLSYGSWIEKNLITVAILTYNFTALSSIVIVIWNRDALLRIVSIKKEFDNKVRILSPERKQFFIFTFLIQMKMMDHRVDERSFKRHFLIFLLVALGLTTLSTVTSTGPYVTLAMAADNISAATNAIFHSVQLWVLVVAQLGLFIIYHYFLLSMQMRYHCLNIALEKTLAASKDFASKSYKLTLSDGYFDGLAEFASRIAVLHSHLTEGVRLINKCYAFQVTISALMCRMEWIFTRDLLCFSKIMVYMGCSFASTVGTLFSMYRRSNIGEQYTMNFQITCLLWIMHGLLIVAGTIYVANITVKEVRKPQIESNAFISIYEISSSSGTYVYVFRHGQRSR